MYINSIKANSLFTTSCFGNRYLPKNNEIRRVKKLLPFLFILYASICFGQNKTIDSLSRVLKRAGSDKIKKDILILLSNEYENYKPDSAIFCIQQVLQLVKNEEDNNKAFESKYYALYRMATLFRSIANYPKALEYDIETLKLAEAQQSDTASRRVAKCNLNIAGVLELEQEYERALSYYKVADSIINKDNLSDLRDVSLGCFGNMYYRLDKPDSALYLTMMALELSKKQPDNDLRIGVWLNNLGNIYRQAGNLPAAKSNYEEALIFSEKANDMDNVCESSLGLAAIFEKTGDTKSAIAFAQKVLLLAKKYEYASRKLQAFEFLTGYYKRQNQLDSAFRYQEQMLAVKDNINSNDRIRASLNIAIDEELRQHEKRELIQKEKEEMDKTLQLLGVGMLIPSFFLFTIFLRRRKIKPQIIKFCGVVSLLMLFECLTLILHPYVVEISNHIVVIELLIFVGIAAIIIPTHHKIEHWLLSKLTAHKNAAQQH